MVHCTESTRCVLWLEAIVLTGCYGHKAESVFCGTCLVGLIKPINCVNIIWKCFNLVEHFHFSFPGVGLFGLR